MDAEGRAKQEARAEAGKKAGEAEFKVVNEHYSLRSPFGLR